MQRQQYSQEQIDKLEEDRIILDSIYNYQISIWSISAVCWTGNIYFCYKIQNMDSLISSSYWGVLDTCITYIKTLL